MSELSPERANRIIGEVLEALRWDAGQVDELLVNEAIPETIQARLVAIREHLQRYQELLQGVLSRTEADEKHWSKRDLFGFHRI